MPFYTQRIQIVGSEEKIFIERLISDQISSQTRYLGSAILNFNVSGERVEIIRGIQSNDYKLLVKFLSSLNDGLAIRFSRLNVYSVTFSPKDVSQFEIVLETARSGSFYDRLVWKPSN